MRSPVRVLHGSMNSQRLQGDTYSKAQITIDYELGRRQLIYSLHKFNRMSLQKHKYMKQERLKAEQ